jgi:hypothetical protein
MLLPVSLTPATNLLQVLMTTMVKLPEALLIPLVPRELQIQYLWKFSTEFEKAIIC